MTTQTTDHSLTFELVNDKAELLEALDEISDYVPEDPDAPWYIDMSSGWNSDDAFMKSLRTMISLVPRLMQSYEQLLETSYALADAWESYMNDQTPAGLYVPN